MCSCCTPNSTDAQKCIVKIKVIFLSPITATSFAQHFYASANFYFSIIRGSGVWILTAVDQFTDHWLLTSLLAISTIDVLIQGFRASGVKWKPHDTAADKETRNKKIKHHIPHSSDLCGTSHNFSVHTCTFISLQVNQLLVISEFFKSI